MYARVNETINPAMAIVIQIKTQRTKLTLSIPQSPATILVAKNSDAAKPRIRTQANPVISLNRLMNFLIEVIFLMQDVCSLQHKN